MIADIEDRGAMPSASAIERLALCPGSYQVSLGLPEQESDAAASGTRIHEALAGRLDVSELTEDEETTLRLCQESAAPLVVGADTVFRDQERLWFRKGVIPIYSGLADVIALFDNAKHAVILDYKTGRVPVPSSTENLQLRALAALVAQNYPDIETVKVGIIQPWVTRTVTLVEYDREALQFSAQQVREIIEAAMKEDAPLNPSEEACRYCRARSVCPALQKAVEKVSSEVKVGVGMDKKAARAAISQADASTLAHAYSRLGLVKILADAIEEEAFERLAVDPGSLPGYTIELDKPRISDAEKLYERAWLRSNGLLDDKGRAKRGSVPQAKAAREAAFAELISLKSYERQFWRDGELAMTALRSALSDEELRRVAGKVVPS
jgi:CRISPR/Cas system-associated exonuclease Cas4 (RecB family)